MTSFEAGMAQGRRMSLLEKCVSKYIRTSYFILTIVATLLMLNVFQSLGILP